MGASKDLFLRIAEEDYLRIPEIIREDFLRDKIYSESQNDFDELMKDSMYKEAYEANRKTKKDLEEVTYMVREKLRNKK